MDISNNTILITGGTSGFGLEFAKRFLSLGNKVIITGRNQEKLDETKLLLPQVYTYKSDVSDVKQIRRLFEDVTQAFPDLNILINNAGEMRKISLHHYHDLQDITREIDINLTGPVRMVQEFLPFLKSKSNALIMNVSSGIAMIPFPISPIYSASKSGLRAYTKALRIQLKKTNVKVMELVAPGSSTPLNDKFREDKDFNPAMLMKPEKIVDAAIEGIRSNKDEVYPGLASVMRILSRIAPAMLLKQAGKMGESFYIR
jgi:uncharacterized oxidoreductase